MYTTVLWIQANQRLNNAYSAWVSMSSCNTAYVCWQNLTYCGAYLNYAGI